MEEIKLRFMKLVLYYMRISVFKLIMVGRCKKEFEKQCQQLEKEIDVKLQEY